MPKLTKRFVDLVALPVKGEKDLFFWDEDLSGFGLRVKQSGVKSYFVQYRADGTSRRMTLGRHGVLAADEARKLARQQLGSVAHGADPARERTKRRQAPTVRDLAADYLERYAIPNKRESSLRNDRQMLDKIILPTLGAMKVADVTRRDIEPMLVQMKATPYRANRVRALTSKMFGLAVEWEWCEGNPVNGIAKYGEHKRERWLSPEEMARLVDVLARHPNQRAAAVVRLLMLTGARKSEVMHAEWGQFDLERGVWTKPAHFTKQKRSHHFPLSDAAVALLRELRAAAPANARFVFPGDVAGQPIQCIKKFWAEIREAAKIPDARLHDLRHTFASHLVSSGVSLPIVGRLLGHTQAQTTERYAHLADDPLREAVNRLRI
jgi:integrase